MNKDYNPEDYKKEHEPLVAVGENPKIEVPIRRVMDCGEQGFAVFEFVNIKENLWVGRSNKFHDKVDDAYIELGKMAQRQVILNMPEKYMLGNTHVPEKLTITVQNHQRQADGSIKVTDEEMEIL